MYNDVQVIPKATYGNFSIVLLLYITTYGCTEKTNQGVLTFFRDFISLDVASALWYLHDDDMIACIGDFGLARLMSTTIGYAAPGNGSLNSSKKMNHVKVVNGGDESKMTDMSERALKAAHPKASAKIAQHVLSLISLSRAKK